jgi:hypothetical protein
MFPGGIWFLLGPWYTQTFFHQDLHDPLNFTIWVAIGSALLLDGIASKIADAIKAKKP